LSHDPISVFDIFKIGIGPSSSHTLGPWRAAQSFIRHLEERNLLPRLKKIQIVLFGSLAKTGKGHGTDIAIQLGLAGYDPVLIDSASIPGILASMKQHKALQTAAGTEIPFDGQTGIDFRKNESLPYHPNALRFLAVDTVEKAKSGHPGAPLGDAPMAYLLFHKIMRHNPARKQAERLLKSLITAL